MNEDKLELLESALSKLSEKEIFAYRRWQDSDSPPLSPDTQAKLFALFLNGKDLNEIRRLYPTFTLGQIVHARITGEWDKLKDEHTASLLKKVSGVVQQRQLESITFISDLIAAANLMYGDKIARYIATRDEKELGDLQIRSLKSYGDAWNIMNALLGKDNQKNVNVDITHYNRPTDVIDAEVVETPPSADEAAAVLKELLGKK